MAHPSRLNCALTMDGTVRRGDGGGAHPAGPVRAAEAAGRRLRRRAALRLPRTRRPRPRTGHGPPVGRSRTTRPVASLRLLTEPAGERRIGRVCTAPAARGRGLSRRLMTAALQEVGDARVRARRPGAPHPAVRWFRFRPERPRLRLGRGSARADAPRRSGRARPIAPTGKRTRDMSDDAGRGRLGRPPAHGNAGPADPSADPVTEPGMRLPVPAEQPTAPVPAPGPPRPDRLRRRPPGRTPGTGPGGPALPHRGLWVGLILSALVLLFLLVFILQNGAPVQISFFALAGRAALGVALLLAAIAGHPARRHPRQRADLAAAPRRPPRGPSRRLTCCASRAARCPSSAGRACTSAGSPRTTRPTSAMPPRSSGATSRRGSCGTRAWTSRCAATSPTSTTSSTPPRRARARGSTASRRCSSSGSTATWPRSACAGPTHEPRAHNYVAAGRGAGRGAARGRGRLRARRLVWFRRRRRAGAGRARRDDGRALAAEFGDGDDVGRRRPRRLGATSPSGGPPGRAPGRPSPPGRARGARAGRAGTPSARRWR